MMVVADIKRQALDLGFSACGIARAERVDDKTEQGLRKWLSDGMNAGWTIWTTISTCVWTLG